jgi:quinol monooxygenase YgiN
LLNWRQNRAKKNEVAKFLRDGQGLVQQEPATTAWFGIRLGPTTFAIFDAFPDDAGRDAHLSGKVAKALMEKAPELLAEPPKIEKADRIGRQVTGLIGLIKKFWPYRPWQPLAKG